MSATRLTRRVYDGAPVYGNYRIAALTLEPFAPGEVFHTEDVRTLGQYSAGCRKHAACFGHMCKTPTNMILPPQSMSMRSGPIVTEYLKASAKGFTDDAKGYTDALKSTNYTKKGHMRSTMYSPVSGSARLVASPHGFDLWIILVSPELARGVRFCAYVTGKDGALSATYKDRCLLEGDWVLVSRQPSLSVFNDQPLRVMFWNKQCIGIHSGTFSGFHGDFDGDEAHIYPITSPDAVAECERWVIPHLGAFEKGRRILSDTGLVLNPERLPGNAAFLEYSTLSAKQLLDGDNNILLADESRMKRAHLSDMHTTLTKADSHTSFVTESIRGTGDIARQQLSQRYTGDLTRVAKSAGMCLFRHADGTLRVVGRKGVAVVDTGTGNDSGSPCVRSIMSSCGVAQQAVLDSHKAEKVNVGQHDFISDIFIGGSGLDEPSRHTTMFMLVPSVPQDVLQSLDHTFIYDTEDYIVVLATIGSVPSGVHKYIVGTYNPVLLSAVFSAGGDVFNCCIRSLRVVCALYQIQVTPDELNDLSRLLVYDVHASPFPITCRPGIAARSLGWIETLMATDYSKIERLMGIEETPETSAGAMLCANFTNLKARPGF